MLNRAKQRLIDDDDERKSLYKSSSDCYSPDGLRKEIEQYDFEYPYEKNLPILLLSYVGPQHARYFYACLNGNTLLIQQSEPFDFRMLDPGTWNFFRSSISESALWLQALEGTKVHLLQ